MCCNTIVFESHLVQYRQSFLKESDIERGECSSQEGLLFEGALILLSLLPRVSSAGNNLKNKVYSTRAKHDNLPHCHKALESG